MLSNLVNHPTGSRQATARAMSATSRRDPLLRQSLRFCAVAEANDEERTAYGRDGGAAIVALPPLASPWDAIFSSEASR